MQRHPLRNQKKNENELCKIMNVYSEGEKEWLFDWLRESPKKELPDENEMLRVKIDRIFTWLSTGEFRIVCAKKEEKDKEETERKNERIIHLSWA